MRIIKSAVRSVVRRHLMRSAMDRHPALIVLLYHAIDPDPPAWLTNLGVVTRPFDFAGHMRWARGRFDVVSLSDGIRRLRDGSLKRTSIAVTVDDGLHSFAEHGLPALADLDIPCTLFINDGCSNGRQQWVYEVAWLESRGRMDLLRDLFGPVNGTHYAPYLRRHADARVLARRSALAEMSSEMSAMPRLHLDREWLASHATDPLIELGNHSYDHPRFSRIAGKEQQSQIMRNDDALNPHANYRRMFGLPFGTAEDWNRDTISSAASTDHEFITAYGGVNPVGQSGIDIRRIPCDGVSADGLEEHIIAHGMGVR